MNFDPKYLNLGPDFYQCSAAAKFEQPKTLLWNEQLAQSFGLSQLAEPERAQTFSGQSSKQKTYASLAYAGHQFGHFNPALGDGRAHLLAEVIDSQKNLWELHMKGSGPTPFSRGGDGFCALGPALREYIMSEAMAALEVPTCRTLAVVATGNLVNRQQAMPGAVVTRAAASHIRVGTFQYFAAKGQLDNLQKLADFTIERHYPTITDTSPEEKYTELLNQYIDKQIALVCNWMRVGFIHGVMNTDNMTLSGHTIDFGPCAMLEAYNPKAVFSSIDRHGRYAFGAQADIAYWNTTRFAECLIPLVDNDHEIAAQKLGAVLTQFNERFEKAYSTMLHKKFGIAQVSAVTSNFIESALNKMQALTLDYTNTFTELKQYCKNSTKSQLHPELEKLIRSTEGITLEQFDLGLMSASNPVIIPRNYLVENAIEECIYHGNLTPTLELINALKTPYHEKHLDSPFSRPSADGDQNYVTFCGT